MDLRPIVVRQIPRARFEALAGMSRSPVARYTSEELGWFADEEENILGVLIRDTIDDDYAAIFLARDEVGQFRCFDLEVEIPTPDHAVELLVRVIKWHAGQGLRIYPQGERGTSIDIFKPLAPAERLHPYFLELHRNDVFLPAREIIKAMMPSFVDVDGNFAEQFQTTGFDARLWELYLNAYLHEEGVHVDREHTAPDFLVSAGGHSIAIEASIVGRKSEVPARYFKPFDLGEKAPPANRHEMPIRFGSSLYSKLKREYWKLDHVAGIPLVFAIADFHDDQSMIWSSTSLATYLYGIEHSFRYGADGHIVITPHRLEFHTAGDKQIPSGFFSQPGAEYVSAVLFSANGTISKFNRMGRQAGFRHPDVTMIRMGACHDSDPSAAMPKMFRYVVDGSCGETWAEGLSMFHNPTARHPISPRWFPSIAHHTIREDGQIISLLPDFHPYGSWTWLLREKKGQVVA